MRLCCANDQVDQVVYFVIFQGKGPLLKKVLVDAVPLLFCRSTELTPRHLNELLELCESQKSLQFPAQVASFYVLSRFQHVLPPEKRRKKNKIDIEVVLLLKKNSSFIKGSSLNEL